MSKHGLEKAIRVRANPGQKAPGSRTRRWYVRHSATDSPEGMGCGVIGKGKGLCLPAPNCIKKNVARGFGLLLRKPYVASKRSVTRQMDANMSQNTKKGVLEELRRRYAAAGWDSDF
jgi:hypothetical protein